MSTRRFLPLLVVSALFQFAHAAQACTACYGQSDSALAQGMNMGIFVLLGFIGLVLAGVAGFFVFIIRRAASLQTAPETASAPTDLRP